MEVKAEQKFVRMSPRKIREIVPIVKSLTPAKALEVLPFIRRSANEPLIKVIKSAIANAKVRGLNEADLIFKEIQIGEGPRLKRWRPGARGRTKPYKRRMSHIRVVLVSKTTPSEKLKVKSLKPRERQRRLRK